MKKSTLGLGVLALGLTLVAPPVVAAPPPPLVLIFDASGSMWGRVGGEEKIVAARRVIGSLVDGLPAEASVGLVAYGHRRDGDCADIEVVQPIALLDKLGFKRTVNALQPKGKTPITASIEAALGALGRRQGTVVLVTDGLETCSGDPCAAVREAREGGLDLVLHVIGFDVAKEDVTQLECAAQAGRGLYLPAADAKELSAALATATALPAGRAAAVLSVHTFSEKGLEDATVIVRRAGQKEPVTSSRTYKSAATNPRQLPLPAGTYEVEVRVLGIKGAVQRSFPVTLADGATVTKDLDFSTGELVIGVTRNGALSDASYEVRVPGEKALAASGRTYRDAQHNPDRVRLTAGTYEVTIYSVEISGRPSMSLGIVEIAPGGKATLSHDLPSGTISIGVRRGAQLVDAVVAIKNAAGTVAQSRTYTAATSNPNSFIVTPGKYQVEISVIKGEKRILDVTVAAGETVTRTIDLAGSS